jgi:hypothetical protein
MKYLRSLVLRNGLFLLNHPEIRANDAIGCVYAVHQTILNTLIYGTLCKMLLVHHHLLNHVQYVEMYSVVPGMHTS